MYTYMYREIIHNLGTPATLRSGGRAKPAARPHQNYYNKDDYNSNELEELR